MAIRWLNRAQRYVGEALVGIGIVHTLAGAVDYSRAVEQALQRGWPEFLTVMPGDRDLFAEWFFVSGLAAILMGLLLRHIVQATGTVPTWAGWWLIAITVSAAVVEPQSGIYSLLVVSAIIFSMNRAERRVATEQAQIA